MGRLSDTQADEISASDETAVVLAERYGVSKATIYNTRSGRYHREPGVPEPPRRTTRGRPRTRFSQPCTCGCGTSTMGRWAPGHAMRDPEIAARATRGLRRRSFTDEEFLAATCGNSKDEDRGFDTPCLIWQGKVDAKTGYPHAPHNGETSTRHRHVYEISWDVDLPRSVPVDHLCAQRACVRLDHLEAVAHAVNIRRGKSSPLDESDVRFIRHSGWTAKRLGEKYNMHVGSIQNILAGRRWAGVA
jgi:hypothetical protein